MPTPAVAEAPTAEAALSPEDIATQMETPAPEATATPTPIPTPTEQPTEAPTLTATPSPTPPPPTAAPTATQAPATKAPAAGGKPTTYAIQSGDTLLAIANRFNITLDALLAANKLSVKSVLRIGQQLVIPGAGAPIQPISPTPLPPTAEPTATQAPAETWKTLGQPLYDQIEATVVADRDATRAGILQGFQWLRKQMTQKDIGVIAYSGHGVKDTDGNFFLAPVDVDPQNLLTTGVSGDDFKRVLASLPGRIVVLLDACHSGAAGEAHRKAAFALTDELVRDLATDDYGVIVMASSMGREYSEESDELRHGYFTAALLEGLQGKADYNQDRFVYTAELDTYVADRVRELTAGRQHPTTAKPTSVRSFPLAATGRAPLGLPQDTRTETP